MPAIKFIAYGSQSKDPERITLSFSETSELQLQLSGLRKAEIFQTIKINKGLKVPPMLDGNSVLLMDKKGNIYY